MKKHDRKTLQIQVILENSECNIDGDYIKNQHHFVVLISYANLVYMTVLKTTSKVELN